ncbi:MAG: hypothetical protein VX028_01420 [Nanoarchaeota archaeon]|nr:hypothetical protein [Nanoarchaeota archaeon]
MKEKPVIIFLHGMGGGKKDSYTFKKIFSNYIFIPFIYDSTLKKSISELAKDLEEFVSIHVSSTQYFSLVGVSAGGVISEYYIKTKQPKHLTHFYSICSPHKGTYLPKYLWKKREGVQDLNKNSKLLKNLDNLNYPKTLKVGSLYSKYDLLVPGVSGSNGASSHTNFPLHWIIHFMPYVAKKAKHFIEHDNN